MEGDEDSVAITGWELRLVVMRHAVRRPVGGKRGDGRNLVGANAHAFAAVTAILGRQHQLSRNSVVITFGPAVVASRFQEQQLLGRQGRFLDGLIELRPVRMQLIPPVLGRE